MIDRQSGPLLPRFGRGDGEVSGLGDGERGKSEDEAAKERRIVKARFLLESCASLICQKNV